MKEEHTAKGQLKLVLINSKGEIVDSRVVDNTIVNTGKALVAHLFVDKDAIPISAIAVGVGTNPPKLEDDRLSDEKGRKPITYAVDDATATTTAMATFGLDELNELQLSEAGLFNSSERSVMYSRVLLNPPLKKTSLFSLSLEWKITF